MIAPTIEEIESMSDAEVRAAYNAATAHVEVGLEWWREEIHWRATDRRNRNVERMTLWIAILTLANLVFIAVTVFR
jgi:hypothetical protein